MANRHIIEQAVIDISFGGEEEAFEQQTALSALAKSRLMGVVEEVFNDLSPAGAVCRFESLEIDLGTMNYIGFPAEMESRLRERLRLVVQEKLQSLHTESAPSRGIVPQQRVELEHVAYFLISGRLPWNASLGKGRTIEQLLLHVLHSSGEEFAEFLRRSAQGVTVVQRLVRQFPEETLSEVLKVLAPSHARSLSRLVKDLQALRRANGFVKPGKVEFGRFIWEQLILELRKTGGTGADPKELLGRLVQRIALHEGGSNIQMFTALATEAAQVEQREGRRMAVTGLLQNLINEEDRPHSEASKGVPEQERTVSTLDGDEKRIPAPWTSTGAAAETDMDGGQPTPVDAGDDSRDLIRAFDLYEALQAHLGQGLGVRGQGLGAGEQGLGVRGQGLGIRGQGPASEGQEAGGVRALIEALEREAPWLLLRLYRELQAGARAGAKLVVQLSEDELHRLLTAFLAIMPQAGADGWAELLRAIDTNARRVADPRRFYEQILECLLRDEPIDFDVLNTETRPESQEDRKKEDARALAHTIGENKRSAGPVEAQSSPQLSGQLEEELNQYMKEDVRVSPEEAARLIQTIERMLAQQPGRLRQLAEPLLKYSDAAERLIELLPERLLTRVLALLRASAHNQAQRCVELIATACAGLASAPEPGQLRRLKWQFLFRYLLEEGRPFDEGVFVRKLVAYLAEEMHGPDATEFLILLRRELTFTTLASTRDQHRAILDALSHTTEAKPLPEAASFTDKSSAPTDSLEEEERDYREQIYIANAGLVLAAPYLPRLFAMLNLTENSVFADPNAAERAVHLLQFMVNEKTDAPEYQLVLNKLLCGVRTGMPIERGITISDQEQDTIEGLLRGMIQNWKSIGQTSIAGLRESFLQREGRLQLRENAWHLLVEPRAFDMLLDQIPWSFSMIKHPWMERILYVEWR